MSKTILVNSALTTDYRDPIIERYLRGLGSPSKKDQCPDVASDKVIASPDHLNNGHGNQSSIDVTQATTGFFNSVSNLPLVSAFSIMNHPQGPTNIDSFAPFASRNDAVVNRPDLTRVSYLSPSNTPSRSIRIPDEIKAAVALEIVLVGFADGLDLEIGFAVERLGEYIKKRTEAQEAFAKRYGLERDKFLDLLEEYYDNPSGVPNVLAMKTKQPIDKVVQEYTTYQLDNLKALNEFAATLNRKPDEVNKALCDFVIEQNVVADELEPTFRLIELAELSGDLQEPNLAFKDLLVKLLS